MTNKRNGNGLRSSSARNPGGRTGSNGGTTGAVLKDQPLLALVEWTSGPDSGSFTSNVPVEWIQDFNPKTPLDRAVDFAIEWRKDPMPLKGYPVLDGKVHEISRNKDFLQKKLRDLEAREKDDDSMDGEDGDGMAENLAENPEVQKMIQEAVQKALLEKGQPATSKKSPKKSVREPTATGEEVESVKMVDLGLGLLVPEHVYNRANTAKSPNVMVTVLLQAAYKNSYLVGKTYAGQKKTNAVTKEVIQKPSLKHRKKMTAVRNAVIKKWPETSNSQISQAVNTYIGKLRNKPDDTSENNDSVLLSDSDGE